MNDYQRKQVDKLLTRIPSQPLNDKDKKFVSDLKQFWWNKDLSEAQNSWLNDLAGKL